MLCASLLVATPARAQQRDLDYDWMMNAINTLIKGLAPTFAFTLPGVDGDGDGIKEEDTLAMLSAIVQGGSRVTGTPATLVTQVRADFNSNRNSADTDMAATGFNCILLGIAGYPCRLTQILVRDDVLGATIGGLVNQLLLDLIGGFATVGNNPSTFNYVNGFLNAVIDAFKSSLDPSLAGLVDGLKPDLNIQPGNYLRWGNSPSASPRSNRFGSAGDLDGDATNNVTEYNTAGQNRESFFATNSITPSMHITVQPAGGVFAAGTNKSFTFTVVGQTPTTYLWENAESFADKDDANAATTYGIQLLSNGGAFSGVNTNTFTITDLTYADHDKFAPWVRLSDAVTIYNTLPIGNGQLGIETRDGTGGRSSTFAQIKVVETLANGVRGPLQLCSGALNLVAFASDGQDGPDADEDDDPPTYQWVRGATIGTMGNVGGQTASTYSIGSVTAGDAGFYACDVTVRYGGGPVTVRTNIVQFIFPAAPVTPGTPDLAAASDSGTSSTDNITNDNTPTFTGTAADGDSITIYVNGSPAASGTASGGAYNITLPTQADGTYNITAEAANCVGVSGISSALSVTIDTAAPAVPSTPDLQAASDSGASSTDNITNITTPGFTGTADSGATVTLSSSISGVIGTGTGPNWTIVSSALSQGVHNITATARDVAGNQSAATAALSVTIDTAAPAAPSTPDLAAASDSGASSTDNITNVTTPTFNGTAEVNSTVTIRVNGTPNSSGTASGGAYSIVAATIAAGFPVITATATDLAGNVSPVSGNLNLQIDTTPPAQPSLPDLLPGSDSGISNTDNNTNDTTPDLQGTAEVGSVVTVATSTPAPATLGTPTAVGGTWNLTTGVLADGVYTITAVAQDIAGNNSVASSALSLTIDTTAPAAPTALDLQAASDSGISNSDNITNDNTPSIQGSAAANAAVVLSSNLAGVVASGSANGVGTWVLTPGALANGVHTFTATQTDLAGNISPASAGLAVTIDTVGPTVQSESPARGAVLSSLPSVAVTFSESVINVGAARLSVESISSSSVSGTGAGPYTFSGYTPPADGTVNVALTVGSIQDTAGNLVTADSWTYTKDSTVPTVVLTSGNVANNGATNVSPINFTATFSEGVTGFDLGDIVVGGGAGGVAGTFAGGPTIFTFVVTPSGQGGVTVQVPASVCTGVAAPAGRNNTASLVYNFTYDTIAPTGTVNNLATNDATPSLTGTVNDNTASISISVASQTVPATNNGNGTWTLANNILTTIADGTYDVVATFTDPAGNATSDGSTNELTIDTVAPTVTVNNVATTDNTPPLTGTVNDASAVITVQVSSQIVPATNNGATWSVGNNVLTALPDGVYDVVVTAVDAVGNIGSDSTAGELVIDTVPPVLTLVGPSAVVVNCGAGYTDQGATAIDTRDGNISANVIATGNIAANTPPGNYFISYNVSDAVGNAATLITRTVTITNNCPLSVQSNATNVTKQPGASHTFAVIVSGNIGPLSYEWQKDDGSKAWQPIGETGDSFTIASLDFSDEGQYRCEVSDDVTTVYGPAISLTVSENVLPVGGLAGLSALAIGAALIGAFRLRRKN